MNYPYARSRFKTKLEAGESGFIEREPDRQMRSQTSMQGAGITIDNRRYRHVPRRFTHHDDQGNAWSEIEHQRRLRRTHRNMVAKGAGQTPLFTEAVMRATPRGLARGLAASIKRYSAGLFFSKAMRIRAGKR